MFTGCLREHHPEAQTSQKVTNKFTKVPPEKNNHIQLKQGWILRIQKFREGIDLWLLYANLLLNYYDLKYMPFIYLLELARTVYGYSQYLETALECHLDFANELYNQCICLENYADELSNKLLSLIDMIL